MSRTPIELVLASASPARRATLAGAGISATVVVSSVDEDAALGAALGRDGPLDPSDQALVLARAKAEDVATGRTSTLVLGADSVLQLDGEAHGKPASPEQAVERWQRMRGRSATLHTGHWLVDTRTPGQGGSGATLGATASTVVHFAALSDDEIEAYVATGEPLLVAGAFTLDGLGGAFVTGIEGDPHNVVGLSLPLLRGLLASMGVGWFDLARRGTAHGK